MWWLSTWVSCAPRVAVSAVSVPSFVRGDKNRNYNFQMSQLMFRMVPGNTQTLIIHFITKTNFNAHRRKMFGYSKKKTPKNPTSTQEKNVKYQQNMDGKREQVHLSHPLVPEFSYTPVPECQQRPQDQADAFTVTYYCLPALSAIPALLVPRLGGGRSSRRWLQARVTTEVC